MLKNVIVTFMPVNQAIYMSIAYNTAVAIPEIAPRTRSTLGLICDLGIGNDFFLISRAKVSFI